MTRPPGAVADLDCPEPECGGKLVLKQSRYGPFYGCTEWIKTRCPGAHGAHEDGKPLGIPAPKAVKQARMKAHASFDRLWKERPPRMSRGGAYVWMQRAMNMTPDEAHIGRFDVEQCERLCRHVEAFFAGEDV